MNSLLIVNFCFVLFSFCTGDQTQALYTLDTPSTSELPLQPSICTFWWRTECSIIDVRMCVCVCVICIHSHSKELKLCLFKNSCQCRAGPGGCVYNPIYSADRNWKDFILYLPVPCLLLPIIIYTFLKYK
jgi:hypothetical protein